MKYLIILLTFLFSFACNSDSKENDVNNKVSTFPTELEGTWEITSMGGQVYDYDEIGTITFRYPHEKNKVRLASNTIISATICNTYTISAQIENNSFLTRGVQTTMIGCSDLKLALDKKLSSNLGRTKQYELENGLLILKDENGNTTFILKKYIEQLYEAPLIDKLLVGHWDMVSVGSRKLNKNESGMLVFSTFKNSKLFNFSIYTHVGKEFNLEKAIIQNNTIKRNDQESDKAVQFSTSSSNLTELETEVIANYAKIAQYKIENDLLFLYDDEDRITFTLNRIIRNSQ